MRVFAVLLLFVAALLAPPAQAFDESDLIPVDEAFQLSQDYVDGQWRFHWQIADGYYLYKHRFAIQAADPSAFAIDAIEWPQGIAKHDEFFGDTEIFHDQVTARLNGRPLGAATVVEFRVRYQGCAEIGICYPPQTRSVVLDLPASVGAAPSFNPLQGAANKPLIGAPNIAVDPVEALPLPPEQAFGFEAIAVSPSALLLRFTPAPGYYLYRDRSTLSLLNNDGIELQAPLWPSAKPHVDEHFGDVWVYFDQVEVPLPLTRRTATEQTLELEVEFQGCQTDGICYPPMRRQVQISLPAGPADSAGTVDPAADFGLLSTVTALLLAVLGGLILNLMPCVLPVLSLKVLGLAGSGETPATARAHALWYTAGVLASFAAVGLAALGLRAAGLALGWGFQLQQPLVISVLALVMMAVGLSLSGVFQIGAGIAGLGQSLTEKKGPAGDFFTGVLAVVVATPCTAPFMGSALAFAFTAPTLLAVAIFLALGLGLALPFLLIGFLPGLAQRLPRPGAWMDTFKQALAFPMYLTAVWLAWVLAKQRGADAIGWVMVGAVALAVAAWAWNHWQIRRQAWAIALALLGVAGVGLSLVQIASIPLPSKSAATEQGVVAYSAAALDSLRKDGRVVFINMTADWCVTCKANEKAVLAQPAFRQALQDADAVYMKGDWTNVDPEITHFLEQHGAYGVPLYVVFPRGAGEGKKLPAVLTGDIVKQALVDASR